jgi:hypothetical protein
MTRKERMELLTKWIEYHAVCDKTWSAIWRNRDVKGGEMTRKERMELLTKWIEYHAVCDKTWSDLEKLFGSLQPEGSLSDIIWVAFSKNTAVFSRCIGDSFGWLNWFWLENDMGASGLSAKASSWKKARRIKTLKDLCALIEADLEPAQK